MHQFRLPVTWGSDFSHTRPKDKAGGASWARSPGGGNLPGLARLHPLVPSVLRPGGLWLRRRVDHRDFALRGRGHLVHLANVGVIWPTHHGYFSSSIGRRAAIAVAYRPSDGARLLRDPSFDL